MSISERKLAANRANAKRPRPGARKPWGIVKSGDYRKVRVPGHPKASPSHGVIYEHRWIAELKTGRFLRTDEHVHHVNGDKRDNRPENLCVLPARLHFALKDTQYGEAMN